MNSPLEGSGAWEATVARYESLGLTTSDAQAAADAEMMSEANAELGDQEPTIFLVAKEQDGFWVKDQHGSYYEGPWSTYDRADQRKRLFEKDVRS